MKDEGRPVFILHPSAFILSPRASAVNSIIIRWRRRSRFSCRYWLEAGILTTSPGALEDALVQAFADRLGELVEAPPPLG